MKNTEELKKIFVQFIKFGIIGFINTVISYSITNGCYYRIRMA